jgi:hypothetical protein
MKLWMSAETQSDVYELCRIARNNVEKSVNNTLENREFDLPLKQWNCIIILRDDDDFKEIKKYSFTKRDMDFRLGLNFQDFKNGDDLNREKAIFEMLLRSLLLLENEGVIGAGMEELKSEMNALGMLKGWLN